MTHETHAGDERERVAHAWKPLVDAFFLDRLDISRLLWALSVLIRSGGRVSTMARSAQLRYTHWFACRCCGEQITMATPFRKAPVICGDCEESNLLAGWCRFCDGIPEEMSIEQWLALPLAERLRFRQARQDLLHGGE